MEAKRLKNKKLVARPCDVGGITFEFKENRYYYNGVCGFSKIDRHRNNIQEVKDEVTAIPLATLTDAFGYIYNDKDEVPF